MDFYRRALELNADTIAARRYLHEHAEVGLDLPKTRAFLTEKLTEYGLSPCLCGQSVTARIGQGEPTVLLRADCDALPMGEESGEPFACKSGAAHTCGHDLHAAMLLTAARMLKEAEASLHGSVIVLFQPAEEALLGAKDAIAHGLFEGNPPDRALALHVAAGRMEPGSVFYNAGGVMMTSADRFRIEIVGKGGHAAYPNRAVDPIAIGARIHAALEGMMAREADPEARCVLSVGSFHAGSAANIIPEHAVLEGALHTDSPEARTQLVRRMDQIATGIASAFGGRATLTSLASVPPLICDRALTEAAVAALPATLRAIPDMRAGASEDFAVIAAQVPATMLYLSAGFSDARGDFTAHHPRVRFNEAVLPIGAAVYADLALTENKQ